MFFQVDIKCLILDEIPMPEVLDKKEVALEIRQLLIIKHESFDGELLSAPPFYATMHDTI